MNKCDSKVRKDIIERLIQLQTNQIEIKDYKVIDEDMLDDVQEKMNQNEEMER